MNYTKLLLDQLDSMTAQLSIDQLLSELQIIVERMSFSYPNGVQRQQNSEVLSAQINILFNNEVSKEMLGYVQWLMKNGLLNVIVGEYGVLLLNYCLKKYKGVIEIKFITPVIISHSLQSYIREKMLRTYPQGTRLTFLVQPSLIAGFIVSDGTRTIDRSLREVSLKKLRANVEMSVTKGLHG